jgi:hypothetical protein
LGARSELEVLLATAAAEPSVSPDALFAQAAAFDRLGRDESAQAAYLQVLKLAPDHVECLTALGRLLLRSGRRTAAKTALGRVLALRPGSPAAHVNLALAVSADDLDAARAHYLEALKLDPQHREASQGLAILLLRAGEVDRARARARIGGLGQALPSPYRGQGRAISLLLLQAAAGGNVAIDRFIDDRVFARHTLATEFYDPALPLPPHDLVFNAIGDADLCGEALDRAALVVAATAAPVLNPPARVRATGRAANAESLGRLPGVTTARMREWPRAVLTDPAAEHVLAEAGFRFPLLLRAPGFHTGEHFAKVDTPAELRPALDQLPGATVLVLEFLAIQSPDAHFRKYRVMVVGPSLYPLHLAVSQHWKVHLFTAAQDERCLAEDRAFLRDMPGVLGERALASLGSIVRELGLDYGGVDFALDANGNVAVFEANATMIVPPPSEDPRLRYRIQPVTRIEQAVRRLLADAARQTASLA